MKDIKWVENENNSHYHNINWFCNIYYHDGDRVWYWSVDHKNALIDPLDNRCYSGKTITREQAKILVENMLKTISKIC